jgi:hypothetical protein
MAKEMILHALWPRGHGPTSSKISPKGITYYSLSSVSARMEEEEATVRRDATLPDYGCVGGSDFKLKNL